MEDLKQTTGLLGQEMGGIGLLLQQIEAGNLMLFEQRI